MQNIIIFGSTGSIGKSTLEVLRLHPDKYQVFALTANSNIACLIQQCQEFKPRFVWLKDTSQIDALYHQLSQVSPHTHILSSNNDLAMLAGHPEVPIIMSAIVGSAGLVPTYYAALTGKRILLANKESLVAGGSIITAAARQHHSKLIPVDSEHSAIYQALPHNYTSLAAAGVNKLILTASGGPFLNTPQHQLATVTAAEAIKHPNWSMGKKISVDSATLMNKGLELIEANWLFAAHASQLEVVIHPQSIIHSMVEYSDNSIIAQLGTPDMKTPISYALSAPQRIASGSKSLNFYELHALTFSKPDLVKFPCLQLALECLKNNSQTGVILNAANEIAVEKYLANQHGFYAIPKMIETALAKFAGIKVNNIQALLEFDHEIRNFCLNH